MQHLRSQLADTEAQRDNLAHSLSLGEARYAELERQMQRQHAVSSDRHVLHSAAMLGQTSVHSQTPAAPATSTAAAVAPAAVTSADTPDCPLSQTSDSDSDSSSGDRRHEMSNATPVTAAGEAHRSRSRQSTSGRLGCPTDVCRNYRGKFTKYVQCQSFGQSGNGCGNSWLISQTSFSSCNRDYRTSRIKIPQHLQTRALMTPVTLSARRSRLGR